MKTITEIEDEKLRKLLHRVAEPSKLGLENKSHSVEVGDYSQFVSACINRRAGKLGKEVEDV